MEWASYFLGVLSGLTVAALIGLARLLLRKRAAHRLDTAVAGDSTFEALQDAVAALDEALHPIPTPASGAGDAAANNAITEWKGNLITAITHLQFTVPNAPSRPIPDPSLVDRIDKMEQMAAVAVAELGQLAGVCGQRGDEVVGVGLRWGYEMLSEARFVLKCYETALREHLRREPRRSSS